MRNRKLAILISAAVVVMSAVGAVGLYDWKTVVGLESKSGTELWEQLSCRAQLYLRKARGSSAELSQLSWTELWGLTRPGVPFHCDGGTSLEAGLRFSSFASAGDRTAGAGIFHERCTACHGNDGSGSPHGPSLIQSNYEYGDSDMAMYRVLEHGVRGTAMRPTGLPSAQALQVIAYVKALQARLPQTSGDKPPPRPPVDVSNERLRTAGTRTDEWLTYSGAYNGQRYTPLDQITPADVAKLQVRWIRQFPGDDAGSEATPLVINGVIYTALSGSHVAALDAKTGEAIWNYRRPVPDGLSLCCGQPNRGLAVYGTTRFFGSLDGFLIALNASDGTVEWQTQVARSSDGYTLTGAPLVVNHSVVVGVAGGEFGVRGFLAAFDVSTGQKQWQFDTIPGPGEFGHDTWRGELMAHRRRPHMEHRKLRSLYRSAVLGRRQSKSRFQWQPAPRRQLVHRQCDRLACKHGQVGLVLPVHAAR